MEFDLKILYILIGGLVAFLSTTFRDYLIEGKKEKKQYKNLKREKIEEIFVLLNETYTSNLTPIMQRKTKENNNARLAMTIRFYFPNLEKDYQKFLKIHGEIFVIHMKNIETNEMPLKKSIEDYSKEYSKFVNIIVKEAKNI